MKGVTKIILGVIGALVIGFLLMYVEVFKIEPVLDMLYTLFNSLTLNILSGVVFT